MTGKHNGCIPSLDELLNRPLQWFLCLLHTNELPLEHVFAILDGATSGPDTFAEPIVKKRVLYQIDQLLSSSKCLSQSLLSQNVPSCN